MKFLKQSVILLACALPLVSCNEESWVCQNGQGGIRLNLQASGDVKDAVPVLRASEQIQQVPAAEDFSIKLDKTDGSLSKSWESLEAFHKEEGFATGSYTLTALYGSETEEGFEKPCFKGEASVNVIEGRETAVDVTATLFSSMVSIDYTDAFKEYFASWSAQVHSEGHDYIDFTETETRPAYLIPGEVAVAVTMTDASGRTVTLQPAAFAAEGRHHYHITFDVNNGQVGQAQLVVKFDDSVVQEDVNIDLTEELFTTPAPEIKASGFASGDNVEVLEGNAPEGNYKFQVLARGGLQSVTLTVNSADYTPVFGSEIDLMTATAAQREQLAAAGIDCKGLWQNPDRMALVDISGFLASLPAGTHEISLLAKDRFTRISEPVSLTAAVEAVTMNAKANDVIFGNKTAIVDITFNGSNAENAFTFKALDNYGAWQSCEVTNMEVLTTRAFDSKTYRFTISIPDCERSTLPVAVYYNRKLAVEVSARVITPTYNVSVDAYARNADITVTTDEAANLPGIVDNLRVYVGGQKVPESNLTRNGSTGVISLVGLKGATEYILQTTLTEGGDFTTDEHFTTEAEAGVPNGDFETLQTVIDNVSINSGGRYKYVAHLTKWYTNNQTFNVAEPTGWATVNAKTFNRSASTQNTWFVFPSTLNVSDAQSGSTAMLVRSVGYDFNGTVPEDDSHAFSGDQFNRNVATVAQRAAGKLFLGSYAINTGSMAETYNQGVAFTSRPSSLQGYYKYNAVNGDDKGTVTVHLYNGTTLVASGSAELASAGSYTSFNVPLTYEVKGLRPTQLRVMFASSNKASTSYSDETANVPANGIATAEYQSFIGSQLTVDNLSFQYGKPAFKARAKRVVVRKVVRKK